LTVVHLYWSKLNGSVLPEGSVRSGKDVLLRGRGYASAPENFAAQRRFGALLRRFRQQRGKPPIASVGPPLQVGTKDADEVQAGPLTLPTPGHRVKWRIFFEDEMGNSSKELHLSRLGTVKPAAGLPAEMGGAGIEFDFVAAIDPVVRVSVITPWGTDDEDFREYARELAGEAIDDDEDVDEATDWLLAALSRFLPPEPPPGWEMVPEQREFVIDEGESARIGLSIAAPTVGTVVFALQLAAEVDGERLTTTSEPLAIHVPEDGSQGSLLFGDGDAPGGDSSLEPEAPEFVDATAHAQGEPARAL
jgi:hypothetical protein